MCKPPYIQSQMTKHSTAMSNSLLRSSLCMCADQLLTLTSGSLPGPHRFHVHVDTLPAYAPE